MYSVKVVSECSWEILDLLRVLIRGVGSGRAGGWF